MTCWQNLKYTKHRESDIFFLEKKTVLALFKTPHLELSYSAVIIYPCLICFECMCSNGLETKLSVMPQEAFGLSYENIEVIDPCRKNKLWSQSTRNLLPRGTCTCLWEEPLNTWERERKKTIYNSVITKSKIQTELNTVQSYPTK